MFVDVNPFQYVLSWQILKLKFNKWIVILEYFDLDFLSTKSKKSIVFVELISKFPSEENIVVEDEPFPDEYIFLNSTSDPWYGDILVYLQTLKFPATFSCEHQRNIRVNKKTTS